MPLQLPSCRVSFKTRSIVFKIICLIENSVFSNQIGSRFSLNPFVVFLNYISLLYFVQKIEQNEVMRTWMAHFKSTQIALKVVKWCNCSQGCNTRFTGDSYCSYCTFLSIYTIYVYTAAMPEQQQKIGENYSIQYRTFYTAALLMQCVQ